ncbi:MAG: tetratricopeptide repeat protein [Planctomycetia bacterium]|nr:tetratricopeptide repeat protein [Planctomycetia bacterium]
MRIALLVEYYQRLPERRPSESPKSWAVRLQEGLEDFKKLATARYSEGTFERMLTHPNVDARRAAVLAMGLAGTMTVNKAVAACLHDGDNQVRQLAGDALWSMWFRAESESNVRELHRLVRLRNPEKALAGFETLLKNAPGFAEAYNQRAILFFRTERFQESIGDCETALKLNPCHFGAQAGIGQCYMRMRKPRAALRAFRQALRINPNLEGVEETIRSLEDVLGEEGRTGEK